MELSEVREQIDRVDREMRRLFLERMSLSEQVVRIKAETGDGIYKPDREKAIIEKQTANVDARLAREYTAFIKRIMEVSRKYQYGRMLELRKDFPFACAEEEKEIRNLCVRNEDIALCDSDAAENVLAVHSYEDMGAAIRKHLADAGMGVLGEVGGEVSHALYDLLLCGPFFITKCTVKKEAGESTRQKVITFTDTLEVLPEHDRICLAFTCGDRCGSLGGILTMIADYGVNLTEFHSRPYRQDDGWGYRFFAELDACMGEPEIRALLYQLSRETTELRILGSYVYEEEI